MPACSSPGSPSSTPTPRRSSWSSAKAELRAALPSLSPERDPYEAANQRIDLAYLELRTGGDPAPLLAEARRHRRGAGGRQRPAADPGGMDRAALRPRGPGTRGRAGRPVGVRRDLHRGPSARRRAAELPGASLPAGGGPAGRRPRASTPPCAGTRATPRPRPEPPARSRRARRGLRAGRPRRRRAGRSPGRLGSAPAPRRPQRPGAGAGALPRAGPRRRRPPLGRHRPRVRGPPPRSRLSAASRLR